MVVTEGECWCLWCVKAREGQATPPRVARAWFCFVSVVSEAAASAHARASAALPPWRGPGPSRPSVPRAWAVGARTRVGTAQRGCETRAARLPSLAPRASSHRGTRGRSPFGKGREPSVSSTRADAWCGDAGGVAEDGEGGRGGRCPRMARFPAATAATAAGQPSPTPVRGRGDPVIVDIGWTLTVGGARRGRVQPKEERRKQK